jgi:hypothetical protein
VVDVREIAALDDHGHDLDRVIDELPAHGICSVGVRPVIRDVDPPAEVAHGELAAVDLEAPRIGEACRTARIARHVRVDRRRIAVIARRRTCDDERHSGYDADQARNERSLS